MELCVNFKPEVNWASNTESSFFQTSDHLIINRFNFSFLQGNIQRSQLVVEQLGDSRKSMVKVSGNMQLRSTFGQGCFEGLKRHIGEEIHAFVNVIERFWLFFFRGKIQNLATTNHRISIRHQNGMFRAIRARRDTVNRDTIKSVPKFNWSCFFPQVLDHRQRVMEIIQKQMNKRNAKKKSQ